MLSIFWTPGVGTKPWWVPDPIEVDWNKLNREIKLGENWDREAQLKSCAMMDKALTKEELEAIDHDEKLTLIEKALLKRDPEAADRAVLLNFKIKSWNAEFIRDLPEEQQWAFVNTMDSLRRSALHLSNTAWMEDDGICGALYGQCEAKIRITNQLLGGKYADKFQEALDWFFDNTVIEYRKNSLSGPLYKDNPRFIKFEQLFKQLGDNINGREFKQQLKNALEVLDDSVGNKFDIRPRQGGGTWANFVGFLVTDWDDYFQLLISSGFKNFSLHKHEIDTIA